MADLRCFQFFGAPGRCYGAIYIGVHRRAYVVGALRCGLFYRFAAPVHEVKPGIFDSTFGLRTSIGAISLMLTKGMKDEVLAISPRRSWIRHPLHISRTGCLSIVIGGVHPSMAYKDTQASAGSLASSEVEESYYDNQTRKEWY